MEQTRIGSGRKAAFTSVTEKLNLTDFSLFSTSVIQAERFGTGISKMLQQLSLTIRDKQSQRAEKAVQEMPVKLLFPLIFFIMPVTFLIIFGPIILQFLHP
jgi:tight adherence protein C